MCLCAGDRPESVSMAPSLRKARELHHLSLCVFSRLCECVCGFRGPSVSLHVSWCVCACRCAHVQGKVTLPLHSAGGLICCSYLSGPLAPLLTCRPPAESPPSNRELGRPRDAPSASALVLAFQERVDRDRQVQTSYPFSPRPPRPQRTLYLLFHRRLCHFELSPFRAILHMPLHQCSVNTRVAAPCKGRGRKRVGA